MAFLGYAVGFPGIVASQLLILSFYALKDAQTPLLTNIATLGMRVSLILVLLRVLPGPFALLALPLAASVAGPVQTLAPGLPRIRRFGIPTEKERGRDRPRHPLPFRATNG